MNNVQWSYHILSSLKAMGLSDLCIAPGSRSSPLIAAAMESGLRITSHFDERGLGFIALGMAKVQKKPVAIAVTSGTAAGNLLPSIMEASHDDIPLIILTADRPPELLHCGSNQTTDQSKLFGGFVRFAMDLPCSDPRLFSYLESSCTYAVFTAKRKKGPVHLNCMFRDPLIEPLVTKEKSSFSSYEQGELLLRDERIEEIATTLSGIEQGLLILGQEADPEALLLADSLKWPIIADVTSSLRGYHPFEIKGYEHLIKLGKLPSFQAVIQCGKRLTSKILIDHLAHLKLKLYYQIDDSSSCFNPSHTILKRFCVSPSSFFKALSSKLPAQQNTKHLDECLKNSLEIHPVVDSFLAGVWSEPSFVRTLAKSAAPQIFFANSMPIRDGEAFFFPSTRSPQIFVNRGLSGIDGNIATAYGIAKASGAPLIALLGDLSFLYDLNSLSLLQKEPLPILFLIVNNDGGGIFSFLPHLQKSPELMKLITHPHALQFQAAASLFQLPYCAPKEEKDLDLLVRQFLEKPEPQLIELHTEREWNVTFHKHIEKSLEALV